MNTIVPTYIYNTCTKYTRNILKVYSKSSISGWILKKIMKGKEYKNIRNLWNINWTFEQRHILIF